MNWRKEILQQHEQVKQKKWQVRWGTTKSGFRRYEVFTDPSGVEWVRARSQDATELEIKLEGSKTRGLPPLRLKRRSRPFGTVVGSIGTPPTPTVSPLVQGADITITTDGVVVPNVPPSEPSEEV